MPGLDLAQMLPWAALLALAGVIGGLLAGLLGVGGGIVTVPVLFQILGLSGVEEGLRMKIAVATSLTTIILTSAVSIRSHHKRGAIDLELFRGWFLPILIGVIAGTASAGYVDGRVLSGIFGAVALLVAIYMAVNGSRFVIANGFPNAPIRWFYGAIVGAVSAMMGIGGGTLSVPILSAYGYDIRRAVGTAAAIGFIIAIPGSIGYIIVGWSEPGLPPASLGYINLLGVAILAPVTMFFAPIGARLAHSIPRRALQLCFATFLAISATRMLIAFFA